jgi:hypothetical protein
MPIICFEGASAVGKTTTATAFKENFGASVVPEVNLLFERPQDEPRGWYFERQIDRWALAEAYEKKHELVIMDGDPFQPLWYNWAYDYVGWEKPDFSESFYRHNIQDKMIRFPDFYFIFSINEVELRKRKENDLTRLRRGFEHHLRLIDPQHRYFQAMQRFSPDKVFFLEAVTLESNLSFIQAHLSGEKKEDPDQSEVLFNKMVSWLRENEP